MRLPTLLLRRKLNAHKGDFGHVFILAGSLRFSGAGILSAEAAIRSGAGLVTLGIPQGLAVALIKIKPKEVMLFALPQTRRGTLGLESYRKIKDFSRKSDVLAIGPGLTQEVATQRLVRKVISKIDRPQVIDADGLNALVGHLGILKGKKILTPHPAEMSRLAGNSVKDIQSNRVAAARKFAAQYKVTVALKGHRTVVADDKGNLYVNETGNPGMATAGSGDVLTGMIAAFLGQGLDAFASCKYAVYLHGLAGDLAAKEKTQLGLIASDIISKIPEAIKKCS